MASSLTTTCYKMLIKKNLETWNLTILSISCWKDAWTIFGKRISGNTSSNFEVFVSLQEVEGILVIIGYSKEDKRFKGEAKCVRKFIQCNKTIGNSRKKDTSVARRIIQTTIISSSTRQKWFDNADRKGYRNFAENMVHI